MAIFGGLGSALGRLFGLSSVGVSIPFPIISIGDGFYPSVQATVADINKLSRNLHNFTEPLTISLEEVIIPSIRENFNAEGRPSWAQLAENTVKARKSSHPILHVTGTLEDAVTSRSSWRVTPSEVSLASLGVSYAAFHQGGTSKMPARQFVAIQSEDVEKITEIFNVWLETQIRKSGFR